MKLRSLLTLMLLATMASCEHEIDFDYPESEVLVVFDGRISDDDVYVRISHTRSMSDSTRHHFIADAQVWIADDDGNEEQLHYDSHQHSYRSSTGLKGVPGHTYTMRAEVDGHHYEATSTMLPPMPVDSAAFRWVDILSERIYLFYLKGRNAIADGRNYCLLRLYRGGELFRWMPRSGRSNIGNSYEYDIVCSSEKDIKKGIDNEGKIPLRDGDTIQAEVLSIDRQAWEFYMSLSYGQASTSNALTNVRGGAQGVFVAASIARPEAIVFQRDTVKQE